MTAPSSPPTSSPTLPRWKYFGKRLIQVLLVGLLSLVIWIVVDLLIPSKADLRKINAPVVAQLETDMWRAYYDKRPAHLYWLLVKLLRAQNQMPFWQANVTAYKATRAAFAFKKGHQRTDYEQAIPYLTDYYRRLCTLGDLSADPQQVAKLELEWWIIHRERDKYGEPALVDAIANATAAFYSVNPQTLHAYAAARTAAMIERDNKQQAGSVTEADWQDIQTKLNSSYTSLYNALNQ